VDPALDEPPQAAMPTRQAPAAMAAVIFLTAFIVFLLSFVD
jgi:hypothetical protein